MKRNEMINRIKELYAENNTSTKQTEKDITQDYDDLVEFRNRIHESDDDLEIFKEDHIALDHILDYMEIFMQHLFNNKGDNE